jgi:DNA repair exonuclease SbcCD nuclease subunit
MSGLPVARDQPVSEGSRYVCGIGDVHGHLQLGLLVAARWQQELGVAFDAVLLAGDVGTFASYNSLDKATRRHAEDNPCELEFLEQWMADPPPAHLGRIFASVERGGLGLTAPVIMVTGNHEGFEHLQPLVPEHREGFVPVGELPKVDRMERIALLPSGWRTVTDGGVTIAGLGGIERDQRKSQYHPTAYITDGQLLAVTEGPGVDVLLTHTGPSITQPFPKGSDLMNIVADAGVARVWLHGHSIEDDAIREYKGTTIVPLHDAAFAAAPRTNAGQPGEDAWCLVTVDDGSAHVDRQRPPFWRDFNQRAWVRQPSGQLVAPQIAGADSRVPT